LEWGMTVCDDKGLTLFQLEIIGTEAPAIQGHSSYRSTSN